jgi:hypothetical protein
VFVNGVADLPAAVEAQKGFHLMPLSAYLRHGLAYQPDEATRYALRCRPPKRLKICARSRNSATG